MKKLIGLLLAIGMFNVYACVGLIIQFTSDNEILTSLDALEWMDNPQDSTDQYVTLYDSFAQTDENAEVYSLNESSTYLPPLNNYAYQIGAPLGNGLYIFTAIVTNERIANKQYCKWAYELYNGIIPKIPNN